MEADWSRETLQERLMNPYTEEEEKPMTERTHKPMLKMTNKNLMIKKKEMEKLREKKDKES